MRNVGSGVRDSEASVPAWVEWWCFNAFTPTLMSIGGDGPGRPSLTDNVMCNDNEQASGVVPCAHYGVSGPPVVRTDWQVGGELGTGMGGSGSGSRVRGFAEGEAKHAQCYVDRHAGQGMWCTLDQLGSERKAKGTPSRAQRMIAGWVALPHNVGALPRELFALARSGSSVPLVWQVGTAPTGFAPSTTLTPHMQYSRREPVRSTSWTVGN
ncbi:hypothetical protein BC827DRAFT_1155190 [Russula dissimulans]|nr:hypothetical protein BC827DRAFT_1155190 [Russula dissimulans]